MALLAAAAPARAEVSVEANLSAARVAPGESVVYSVTITDADGGDVGRPDFGELDARGPSQSLQSSLVFAGGAPVVRSSRVLSWTLTCDATGRYPIGPATFTYKGETRRTRALELACDPEAARGARPGRGGGGGVAGGSGSGSNRRGSAFQGFPDDPFDLFDDLARWGMGTDPFGRRSAGEQDLFLRAVVDKKEAYLGEQITLSLYLFSQADVSGVQTVSFPKLDGFWAEDIEAPTQLVPEIRNIKGVPYRAYMLRRRALFALRAGELTIDPVEAQIGLGLPLFWGAQPETVKRRSSPLTINVKELPAQGRPPGFETGHVGDFRVEATAAPESVALGQPVQLKVVIQGTGNIKALKAPRLALPPGLKTFDPTVTDKVRIQSGRYGGTKTLEYVVIPERTGSFVIPPVRLPFFNAREKRYDVSTTDELAITVSGPGDGSTPGLPVAGAVAPPGATNVLGGGLRPVRLEGAVVAPTPVLPWRRGWFWPVLVTPVAATLLLGLGSMLGGFVRRGDPGKKRVARARGTAGRRLKEARALAEGDRTADFYAAVNQALVTFVTDRTGIGAQGLTRDELARALNERGFAAEDVDGLVRLLETCETARFAPLAGEASERSRVLEDAHRIIDAMDATKRARGNA